MFVFFLYPRFTWGIIVFMQRAAKMVGCTVVNFAYAFSCLTFLGLDQETETVDGECVFLLEFSEVPTCVSV